MKVWSTHSSPKGQGCYCLFGYQKNKKNITFVDILQMVSPACKDSFFPPPCFSLRVAADPLGSLPLLSPQASGSLTKDGVRTFPPTSLHISVGNHGELDVDAAPSKPSAQRVPSPRQELPHWGPKVHGHIAWPFRAMSPQRARDESKAPDRG